MGGGEKILYQIELREDGFKVFMDPSRVRYPNSGKISIDGAELENTDKIIYLNTTVGVEALLKTFKKDMEIDDVQDALGIENSAVSSNVVAGDTAIISPEAESNAGPALPSLLVFRVMVPATAS